MCVVSVCVCTVYGARTDSMHIQILITSNTILYFSVPVMFCVITDQTCEQSKLKSMPGQSTFYIA